ncbi:DUF6463 family protein [Acidovorax sp. D2M1]|uniref:DUF6463 family protein n=1 Tax=Acidovorax benzenivorans TaxID=2987520 RepID=A0ABT5RY49_9BURK|nr:DUF6463 family protein [Acidovorax benzenivorans]MDD2178617.1 DUF6463 family protein [Acidovorax benzenivorans]
MTTLPAPHHSAQRRRLASPWKGLWLMAVAVVHTIFAAVVFEPQLREIARRGVFNSVGTDPMAGAVAWFVLFGGVFALLGWAILRIERSAAPDPVSLRGLGVGLLALTLLGIVLMPSSGFWLVLPPALALCWSPR